MRTTTQLNSLQSHRRVHPHCHCSVIKLLHHLFQLATRLCRIRVHVIQREASLDVRWHGLNLDVALIMCTGRIRYVRSIGQQATDACQISQNVPGIVLWYDAANIEKHTIRFLRFANYRTKIEIFSAGISECSPGVTEKHDVHTILHHFAVLVRH